MISGKLKIGYCAVTADILHYGHIRFLKACKDKCCHLIVGVMSDEAVKSYKGRKPLMNLCERMELVGALSMVDEVTIQLSYTLPKLNGVDIYFDSEEHKRKGANILIPRTKNISSSLIKKRIVNEYLDNSKRKA